MFAELVSVIARRNIWQKRQRRQASFHACTISPGNKPKPLPLAEMQAGIAGCGISSQLTLKSKDFKTFEYIARPARQSLWYSSPNQTMFYL